MEQIEKKETLSLLDLKGQIKLSYKSSEYENNKLFFLNKKIFTALDNSSTGEVGNDTLFYYFQKDDVVWADYYGGEIIKGHLLGKKIDDNKIEFFYHHINKKGDIKIGQCLSEIKIENNKIKLYENWQWLCDDRSSGTSILVEYE